MKVKLVWNFSGEGSLRTAEHHLIHLKEYCKTERIDVFEFGTEEKDQFSSDSYMIVTDELVNKLRGSLKPHQGFKIVC